MKKLDDLYFCIRARLEAWARRAFDRFARWMDGGS